MSKVIDDLTASLIQAGALEKASRFLPHANNYELVFDNPIAVYSNTNEDAAPFAEIFLKFAPKLTDTKEISAVVRCMTQSKGFESAVPWLLSLFHNYPENGLSDATLWSAGNALRVINDQSSYPMILEICKNKIYGSSRQMLMGVLL